MHRAAFAVLLMLCACAGPRPGELPAEFAFERYDAADSDHDGKLSRPELTLAFPTFEKRFERIDTDKSGLVSWAEFKSYARVRRPGSESLEEREVRP